jgi:hypothetical protein
MDLGDFNALMVTELKTELSEEDDTSLWIERNLRFWQEPPQRSFPESFILCSFTKNFSGFQRRVELDSKVRKYGTEISESRDIFGKVLHNGRDKTCFNVSIQRQTAQKVASIECNYDSPSCLIQPLLPMMKIGAGTVERSIRASSTKDNVLIVLAHLSSSSKERNIHFDRLISIIENRSYEECQEQLALSLPSTSVELSCPKNALYTSFIEASTINVSTVQFKIDIEKLDNQMIPETLLAFITGLSARQIIDHVEVADNFTNDEDFEEMKA